VFVSQNGMVQRTSVRGINRYGRASQGVRVMNLRDDDQVSAVALVVESEAQTAAPVAENGDAGLGGAIRNGDLDGGVERTDGAAQDDASGDSEGEGEGRVG
jgi:DNA gyrase subunit A